MSRRACVGIFVAVAIATPGCQAGRTHLVTAAGKPAVTTPARPGDIAQTAVVTTLTGKVKIVSDNGGAVIANNGAGIISNNSGAVISNHGAGLASGTRLGLLQAGGPREFLLADAVVTVEDAAGKPLLDDHGQPLRATTDATGTYTLTAALPAKNLVLRVKLGHAGVLAGGELAAMLPRHDAGTREQAVDTATSLGAAYVLGRYVQGDQRTYDRLPAAEAEKLHQDLDAARPLLTTAPVYQSDALASLTESLRTKAPAVSQELDTIKVLLLGQAALGSGRKATEVALSDPAALAIDAKGNLLVGERTVGRIRSVTPDGTLTTLLDPAFGEIKLALPELRGLVAGPDGSYYARAGNKIVKVDAHGQLTVVAGTGLVGVDAGGGPATQAAIIPLGLAVTPDGTVYFADQGPVDVPVSATTPRLGVVGVDGILRFPPVSEVFGGGAMCLLAPGHGGTLIVGVSTLDAGGKIFRYHPGGKADLLASGITPLSGDGIAEAPDGTVYVDDGDDLNRIVAIAPDGRTRDIGAPGMPGLAGQLDGVEQLVVGADGTLYAANSGGDTVLAMAPDGTWRVVAGATGSIQSGVATTFAINSAAGVLFDAQGRVVVTETGGATIKRYDGTTFATIAGTVRGYAGDGGPATAARLNQPFGIARHGDDLYVLDKVNNCLRKIATDGTISTVAGGPLRPGDPDQVTRAAPVDQHVWHIKSGCGLAISPAGIPYWSDTTRRQVNRLSADGTHVELVAGGTGVPGDGREETSAPDTPLGMPCGLAFDARGDLYVADAVTSGIRKITGLDGPNPTIRTVAGWSIAQLIAHKDDPPTSADGTDPLDVPLIFPTGLGFDASGNLYVTCEGTGNVSRLDIPGMVGESPLAALGAPVTIPYVVRIAPDGRVKQLTGVPGRLFPDPHAEDALVAPTGIAVASDGRLAIVDTGANQIRILPAGSY